MARPTLSRMARRLRPAADARPGEPDRDLLARFTAGGDQEAFAALVRRHGRTVRAACRQVLADPAAADDAFQATFLVLLKKAKSVPWRESLGGWLYAVAHRIAVRARADARRRQSREAVAGKRARVADPPPDLSWREAVAVLHDELDRLPPRYRLPLLLCYLEGQSRDEAAANLGWSAGAVKGCLERGREMLAKRLMKRGVALSAGLLGALAATTAAAGGASEELIELTLRAVGGRVSPAVAALVRGRRRCC